MVFDVHNLVSINRLSLLRKIALLVMQLPEGHAHICLVIVFVLLLSNRAMHRSQHWLLQHAIHGCKLLYQAGAL